MAISINNFVDISTTFPTANVAGRSFGGLVFTTTEAVAPVGDTDLAKTAAGFNAGTVYQLDLDEVGKLFYKLKAEYRNVDAIKNLSEAQQHQLGYMTDEYALAYGYYKYISPSGRFASKLAFARVLPGETATEAFDRVRGETNMFGSFTFLSINETSDSSSEDDGFGALRQVAEDNDKLDSRFLFVVTDAWNFKGADSSVEQEASAVVRTASEEFPQYAGTCFVAGAQASSAYMPMAILASTDYRDGTVVNYMFKQFPTEQPTVVDDKTYTTFNNANVNFYGRTQTNGQTLDFFQRGFNTNSVDTAIFCNEMWFKSACETALMGVLLGTERLSADAFGVDTVRSTVLETCTGGVSNGMFMIKEASAEDTRDIRSLVINLGGTSDDVENILAGVSTVGYSVYAYLALKEDDDNGKLSKNGEYIIRYMVFYGTADSIRHIKGDDILIK